MMGPGNGGPAPPITILWAIRHAVAVSARRAAEQRSASIKLVVSSEPQRRLVTVRMHQAALRSGDDFPT